MFSKTVEALCFTRVLNHFHSFLWREWKPSETNKGCDYDWLNLNPGPTDFNGLGLADSLVFVYLAFCYDIWPHS